jgi:hypothetical protein
VPPYLGKRRRGVDRGRTSAHFRPIRGLHSVLASLSTCLVPPRRHNLSFPSNTCEKYSNSAHFQIYSMPIPEPIRNNWDDLSFAILDPGSHEREDVPGWTPHSSDIFTLEHAIWCPSHPSGWGTGNGKLGPWARCRHHSTMTLRIAV